MQFSGMPSLESWDDNREGRPTVKKSMTDEEARGIGEKTWLHFYNRVLMERGIITEDQYFRMKRRIETSKLSSVT